MRFIIQQTIENEYRLLVDLEHCGLYATAKAATDTAVKLFGADAGAISYEWS